MSTVKTLAERLEDLTTAYISGSIISAAVDIGLVDALEEPRTIAEIAERTHATHDGIERLCRALCAMGILEKTGDTICAPPELIEALRSNGPNSIAPIVRHHHRQLGPLLAHLGDAIRTGEQQHRTWAFASNPPAATPYDELARHPAEYATFLAAMEHGSRGVGIDIGAKVDLSKVRRLVDLGGGGGVVARELLGAFPNLTVESFDVAAACASAKARSVELGHRHLIREGDILRGVDARDADAILLSAVLADWPAAERATILRNAIQVLRPGGTLIVSETLLDDDRRGPPKAAVLSLVLLVAMRGDQLSGRELASEIEAAGFCDVVVQRSEPRDLVTARRPA